MSAPARPTLTKRNAILAVGAAILMSDANARHAPAPAVVPLRLAITGSDHGPELVRAIPLLEHASDVDATVLSPLKRAEKCIR